MRRDSLFSKGGTSRAGNGQMFVKNILHAVSTQAATLCVGKQELRTRPRGLAKPLLQYSNGLLAERRAAFFPPLAENSHVRSGSQNQIHSSQCCDLRLSQARLYSRQQEGVIPTTGPGALVRHFQQRIDLRPSEERHLTACEA